MSRLARLRFLYYGQKCWSRHRSALSTALPPRDTPLPQADAAAPQDLNLVLDNCDTQILETLPAYCA
jgi:hypothetical protein